MSVRSHGYRLIVLALLVSFVATMAVGCGGGSTSSGTSTNQPTSNIKAAMVTDIGGLGDKSFNDLAAAGLSKAKTDLGVDYKVLESKEAADYEPNLTQLATAGYNPIFAVGFLMQDTLSKISTAYPDVTFGGIDISYDPPIANVVGLNFKEQEAAYLAGYLAATLTTMPNVDSRINAQPLIGFVGGMPVPAVNRFQAGYIAGAKAANPAVQVKSIMTGSFTDQQKGLEAGKTLIEAGCDIIFAAAGQTGLGTAKACKDGNALFIGVDADQYNTIPGIGDTIITSAVKRVDSAVFDVVKRANDGTLKGGENLLYGLKEQGVGLAPYHEWDSKVPADVKDKIETAKAAVIDGSVTVPETVQQ
jgi:basic membrane protein A